MKTQVTEAVLMIDTITLLIDNEAVFLNDFISMAKDAKDKIELAEWLQSWFEDALEYEKVKVVPQNMSREAGWSYRHVFQSILAAAIQNIPESDWLLLADHYITKAAESQQ